MFLWQKIEKECYHPEHNQTDTLEWYIEDFFLSVEQKQGQNRRICKRGKQLHSVHCTTI